MSAPRRVAAMGVLLCTIVAAACDRSAGADTVPAAGAGATASATTGAGATRTSATSATPSVRGDTISDSLMLARADRGRILGPDGAMWMIVISDFQCPYCKMWHDSTHAAVKRDYIDKGLVRVAYLNLPLQQHKHARAEAEAALCAGAQSKFWEYSDGLFHQQHAVETMGLIDGVLDSLAQAKGLDLAEFGRCRRSPVVRQIVDSDVQQAQRMGVRSTPTFLIGDFMVEGVGPYPNFKRAIDTALVVARAKAKGKASAR